MSACAEKRGTTAGYQRHRRSGEAACDECRAAIRVYHRHRREAESPKERVANERPIASDPAPWMRRAACKDVPVSRLDFTKSVLPGRNGVSTRHPHLAACAAVCARCLTLADCRAFAERHRQDVTGVWGGAYYAQHGSRHELVAA